MGSGRRSSGGLLSSWLGQLRGWHRHWRRSGVQEEWFWWWGKEPDEFRFGNVEIEVPVGFPVHLQHAWKYSCNSSPWALPSRTCQSSGKGLNQPSQVSNHPSRLHSPWNQNGVPGKQCILSSWFLLFKIICGQTSKLIRTARAAWNGQFSARRQWFLTVSADGFSD